MQTSPLVQHLIDLNASDAERSEGSVLAPFGQTHSRSKIAAAEAAAYERGRRSMEAELRSELGLSASEFEGRLLRDREANRKQWVEGQAERLEGMLINGIAAVRQEMAKAIGHVVVPFIKGRLTEQAIDDITEAADDLVNDGMPLTIELSGPPDLTAVLAKRLEPLATVVKIALVQTPELRVRVDTRIIETRLQGWVDLIEDVLP